MAKFKQIGVAVLSGFLILGTGAELIFANELPQSDIKTVYSDEDCKSLITAYFNAANEKDWDTFMKYVCQEDYNYFVNYFADTSEKNGIKQLDSVNVSDLYKIDESEASQYFITDEYDVLAEGNTYSYVAEINCSTETENQYFIDGYNYILMVLAEENNELKVVQVNKPNTELLEKYVINNVEAEAECYEAKQAGINAIEECDNGRLVGADGQLITEGFEIATAEIADSDSDINPASRSYNKLGHYTTYSYPSSIRVKLNKTGNNAITRVDFSTYMKCVLPNEWYASWNTESLKAGAFCVKMVGIYRAINPISSAGGYDLTQGTQYYVPNSQNATTNAVIDSIVNLGMADSAGILFFPEYAAGTSGSTGTKASGQLKQWGSQKLAQSGYSYKQILNYYYSGSCYSSGDVNLFGYTIGY